MAVAFFRRHMIQIHQHQYGDVCFNRNCNNRDVPQDKGAQDECEPLAFERGWVVGIVR